MFSPYYAWARRRGPAPAERHCAVNVALYGGRRKRWAMTERGAAALRRGADWLEIGASALAWDGAALTIRIEETAAPLPARLRGSVRLHPRALERRVRLLDAEGRHRWSPIAPCARVEVAFDRPALRWSGEAYFDTNDGDRPLEADFIRWDWSRAPQRDGTVVLYEVARRAGDGLSLAMRYDARGGLAELDPPPPAPLPRTRWGIARATRADAAHAPRVAATLEDAPFYARSLLGTRLCGETGAAMHESLALDRFRAPWVQAMLPFRMPRALRG